MKNIIIFITCSLLYPNLTKASTLFCSGKTEEPYSYYKVSACDAYKEECCKGECCPKSKKYLVFFVLLGTILFICYLYSCIKWCPISNIIPTNNSQGRSLFRRTTEQEPEPLVSQSASAIDTLVPEIRVTIPATRHARENDLQPLTPPPAYNVAVFASSAPLGESDKVPSYEEVMAAQKPKYVIEKNPENMYS